LYKPMKPNKFMMFLEKKNSNWKNKNKNKNPILINS